MRFGVYKPFHTNDETPLQYKISKQSGQREQKRKKKKSIN